MLKKPNIELNIKLLCVYKGKWTTNKKYNKYIIVICHQNRVMLVLVQTI